MNPNGISTGPTSSPEELSILSPAQRATINLIQDARDVINTTGCSSEDYNICTESFEDQREACRQEMCELRNSLSEDIKRLLTTPFEEMSEEELEQASRYLKAKKGELTSSSAGKIFKKLIHSTGNTGENNTESITSIHDTESYDRAFLRVQSLLLSKTIFSSDTLTEKYGVLQSLDMIPGINGEILEDIRQELSENGKLSLPTLRKIDSILASYFSVDSLEIQESVEILKHAFDTGEFSIEVFMIDANTKVSVLRELLHQHHEYTEAALFTYDLGKQYFGGCGPDAIIYIDLLRAEYLESKNIQLRENLRNYYSRFDISVEHLDGFEELIQGLQEGGCNIDYIAQIREYNDGLSGKFGTTFDFTSTDAEQIISGVIEYRKSQNELGIIERTQTLSSITKKPLREIQDILSTSDPQIIGEFFDTHSGENPRISEIEGEIFELLDIQRDIKRQEATFEEVVENAVKLYGIDPQFREAFKINLINKFNSLDNAVDFINNLDEFVWIKENIDFIRENVPQRISIIRKPEELIRYFREFPEDFGRDFNIGFLNPSLLFYPDVIQNYPKTISTMDVGLIPPQVFKNNPKLIEKLLLGPHDIRNLIINLSQNKELIGILHQALVNIKKNDPEHSSLLEINLQVLSYDRHHGMHLQEFTGTHNSINGLTKKEIEGKIKTDGVDKHIALIDLFLQSNPDSGITIEGKYMGQEEVYKFLIEKGYFPLLTSLHWNPNISTEIVKTVLSSDNSVIGNVRYIARNHMNDIENIRLLVKGIKESDNPVVNFRELIQYINIVGKDGNIDPIQALDIAVLIEDNLKSVIENAGLELGSGIMGVIAGILQEITPDQRDEIIKDQRRTKVFMMLVGLIQLREATKVNKDTARKTLDKGGQIQQTTEFIQANPDISDEGKKELLLKLQDKREISQEIFNILLREFAGNEGKLEGFLKDLQEALLGDLKDVRNSIESTSHSRSLIPKDALKEYMIETDVDGEFLIDYDKIKISFQDFLSNLPASQKDLPAGEKKQLFLQELLGDIDPESQIYKDISQWITSNEEATLLTHQDINEIISQGTAGTLDEYNQSIRDDFYSGKIFYSPSSKDGENKTKGDTGQSGESFSAQNPEFRIFQRQIGSEMGLNRQEYETLSPKEMQILGSNELARENFLNFKDLLTEYNLDIIWNYRNSIFPLLSTGDGNQFDISRNYLERNEINIFLKGVMYAVTGADTYREGDYLDTTLQKIRVENQLGVLGGVKDTSSVGVGGGVIEREFINRFTHLNDGGDIGRFKISEFKKALRS